MFSNLLRQAALGQQQPVMGMPQQQGQMMPGMQMPGMGQMQGQTDMFGQSQNPTLSNLLRGMQWPGRI